MLNFKWPIWLLSSFLMLLVGLCLLHLQDKHKKYVKLPIDTTSSQSIDMKESMKDYKRFRKQYLVVYFLIMLADWLQGTHMYSLYESYHVNVGVLFLTGFLSSAISGTFVGPLIDKYGRRRACLIYCTLEILINIIENVPNFTILLLGRVLGGISTSILFSAFESWMVTQHRAQHLPEHLIQTTFAIASEGNGLIAILAGVIAQFAADYFGHIGPFRLAVIVTIIAMGHIFSWPENYGSLHLNTKILMKKQHKKKIKRVDYIAYALGFSYSLYEGAMYVFVFLWYPTLASTIKHCELPSGIVFSCFMIAIAIGGKLFYTLTIISHTQMTSMSTMEKILRSDEWLLMLVPAISSILLFIPTVSSSHIMVFAAFVCFEIGVGILTPCSASLRSRYFAKDNISTQLSFFRLPTNLFVMFGTASTDILSREVLFAVCSVTLCMASLAGGIFIYLVNQGPQGSKKSRDKKMK